MLINRQQLSLYGVIALAVGLFVIEVLTPHGFTEGMLYTAVVFLATVNLRPKIVYLVASGCTVLTIAGFILSPSAAPPFQDPPLAMSLTNRSLTIGAFWIIALLGLKRQRAEALLQKSQEEYRRLFEENPFPMWVFDLDMFAFLAVNRAAVAYYGYDRHTFLQMRLTDILLPGEIPRFLSTVPNWSVPHAGIRMTAWKHRKRDGTEFDVEMACYPLIFSEKPAGLVLAHDVSERKRAEESTDRFIRISHKLNSTLDVDRLLEDLIEEAIYLVNGEAGWVGLRTSSGLRCSKYIHRSGRHFPVLETRPDESLAGGLLRDGQAYLINAIPQDGDGTLDLYRRLGVHSVIGTPILDAKQEVLGFFEIHNSREATGFTPVDQSKLMAVSQSASTAIQNALTYRKLEELDRIRAQLLEKVFSSQEEERRRIARELHDEIGQLLTSLLVRFRSLEKASGPEEVAAQVGELRTITVRTLREVQRLALGLRPIVLDDVGLEAALNRFARDYTEVHGIIVDVAVIGLEEHRLPSVVETTVYRIVQEALTNAAKHAAPTTVSVLAQGSPSQVQLIIEDDGCGFDMGDVARKLEQGGRLGLHGMRERTSQLNGTIVFDSEPGKGTTITVRIPLVERLYEHTGTDHG